MSKRTSQHERSASREVEDQSIPATWSLWVPGSVHRLLPAVALASLLGLSLFLYLRGGLAQAYFAADDFQWLAAGHTFTWSHLFHRMTGQHFYRPVIDVWFALGAHVCGFKSACYHIASLGVHLINVSLIFGLGLLISRNLRFATVGTLLFAVQPRYTEAVV